jgi:hypothetical protein
MRVKNKEKEGKINKEKLYWLFALMIGWMFECLYVKMYVKMYVKNVKESDKMY